MKKAGYPQESLFYWGISKFETDKPEISLWRNQRDFENNISNNNFGIWSHGNVEIGDYKEVYSAPLATELLEYVPNWTVAKAGKLTEAYTKGKIRAGDICVSVDKSPEFFDKSLSNALAKMVLYLVKEGLLTFEKI